MRCKFSKLNICRLVAVLMAVTLAAALCIPCSAAVQSGSCGNNITWSYSDGTLTLSGTGNMPDYSDLLPTPWYSFREEIRVVSVGEGITSIGNKAFFNCKSLKYATLPNTIVSIGNDAFYNCLLMKTVTIGNSVKSIGDGAFERCESLQMVRLPSTLSSLGKRSFYRCASLQVISIPSSVVKIGDMAFTYCSALVSAEVMASIPTLPYWMFYGCERLSSLTLSKTITSIGESALYRCDALKTIHYLGTQATASQILVDAKTDLAPSASVTVACTPKSTNTTTSVGETVENNVVTKDTVTVQSNPNSMISTTVTEQSSAASQGTITEKATSSVTIEAVVENNDGWNELKTEIINVEKTQEQGTNIKVSVSVTGDATVSGDVFSDLSGKNIDIKIESADGSTVKIDCEKMNSSSAGQSYTMSYKLTRNSNNTKEQIDVFGYAVNYSLNFLENTDLDYSPSIYLGNINSHKCAVLYQQLNGGSIERLQSEIIDRDGYATFYLSGTMSHVQYFIAIDVVGEKYSNAIVPDEMAVDNGELELYEPIEYVITGGGADRKFMGMNIAQFSFALFGGLAVLVVIFGVVMGIFYRKKRLEMMYRLKMQDQQ